MQTKNRNLYASGKNKGECSLELKNQHLANIQSVHTVLCTYSVSNLTFENSRSGFRTVLYLILLI